MIQSCVELGWPRKRLRSLRPCSYCSKFIAGFTTNYDKAGNKLYERHLHSECRSHAYQMDTANRLTQYQRGKLSDPGPWPTSPPTPSTSLGLPEAMSQVQYDLDMLGNWNNPSFTPADGSTPPNESRQHNALNQISQQAGNNFTYDLNGNLLNDGRLRYEYDAINRLKRVLPAPVAAGVVSDGLITVPVVRLNITMRVAKGSHHGERMLATWIAMAMTSISSSSSRRGATVITTS